jgi:glycosyltransferase involved in cell wall biosynthesis
MVCARGKKIPYIVTPHGSLGSYDLKKKNLIKKFWLNFIDKENLSNLAAFQVLSLSEKDELKKLFASFDIHVIPNGIHMPCLSLEKTKKAQKLNLLFISRLHKKKNIPAILAAVSKLRLSAAASICWFKESISSPVLP